MAAELRWRRRACRAQRYADSSQLAFEVAAKAAFRQTMPKAGPELLEPIMKVDVFVPDQNVGDVIGDLNRRRGIISGQEPTPTNVRIRAEVPLSEMFGCIGDLRSNTQGRGPVHHGVLALRRRAAKRPGEGEGAGQRARGRAQEVTLLLRQPETASLRRRRFCFVGPVFAGPDRGGGRPQHPRSS